MNYTNKYLKYKAKYLKLLNSQIGGGKKYLFIMFQGSGSNLKTWNEYTESKFLDKLKELGNVYIYQDKIHNIWHYDDTNPEHLDFESDIDFNLSYVNVDTHIKNLYEELKLKYKNLEKYYLIPVGWSAGCYLALYFSQLYSRLCKLVILLYSALWTPDNMKIRLQSIKNDKAGYIYPITNSQYKKLLNNWKINNKDVEDAYKISNTNNIIRSEFMAKNLKLKL